MIFPSINNLLKDASQSFLRFPITILSSVITAFVLIYMVEHEFSPEQHIVLFNMALVAMLHIGFSFGLYLFAEKEQFSISKKYLLQVVALILLIFYYLCLPNQILREIPFQPYVQYILFGLATHFFIAFLPYLKTKDINAFWSYNTFLFSRFTTAIFFSATLFLGLIFAYFAITALFDVRIEAQFYFQTFLTITFIFNTWFFVAGIPDDLSVFDGDIYYNKALKIFSQFILIPLMLIYLGILYLYVIKIAVAWTWPRGMVSSLILGIAVLGILALLFLYPLAQKGENSWVKTVSKAYYIVLIPLIVVLWLAIQIRVSSYGITENRYFLILLASWLSFITLYFNLKKQENIKIIPISLFIFIMLAALGPFSAFNVSGRSQTARLEHILKANNMLENGKFSKNTEKLPHSTTNNISSIVDYLINFGHIHRIKEWYVGDFDALLAKSWYHYELKNNLVALIIDGKAIDLNKIKAKKDMVLNHYHLNSKKQNIAFLEDYDYYIDFYNIYDGNKFSYQIAEKSYDFSLNDDFTLSILSENDTIISFNIEERMLKEIKNAPNDYNQQVETLEFVAENEKNKVKFVVHHTYVRQEGLAYYLRNMEGYFLLKIKEQ